MTPAGYSEDHAHTPALIMGNGPSLARIQFSALKGLATFGMNAAYRYWSQIDWWPNYYSCLDLVVGASHRSEIISLVNRAERLGIRNFLLRHSLIRSHPTLRRSTLVTCYEQLLADGALPKLQDITTGSHTLLWANRLGYTTLLLAGVDCDYTEVVKGAADRESHLEIIEPTDNSNYFFNGYQQPGDRFNRPNVTSNMHVRSWTNAARFLQPGTHVVNLNPESRVGVFARNQSQREFLAPGQQLSPTEDALDPETTATDLAELRRTLRRCARYSGVHTEPRISQMLHWVLYPSNATAVVKWRPRGLTALMLSKASNREQVEFHHAYLTVIVRGIGDLVEQTVSGQHQSDAGPAVAIHAASPIALKRLSMVIQILHDALGTPPATIRVQRALKSWLKPLWQLAPARVRSIDYARLRQRLRSSLLAR